MGMKKVKIEVKFLGNEVDGACLSCLPQARLAKEKQPTRLQKMQGYLSFYLEKVAFSNLSIHIGG